MRRPEEHLPADASGLAARALIGWMDREQALKFLLEDCLFSPSLTLGDAEEIWASRKAIVQGLPAGEPDPQRKLPLSAADLKAARKFRSRHPEAQYVVDFVKLNPMDLVVHQLWVSTAIADRYRDRVTPDKWLQTALLDPPLNPRLKAWREGNTILFDLPHGEFFLAGPLQTSEQIRVSEADAFVTVALHANRALLLRGYHRSFACAQFCLEAANAPHGVLFGVSNQLASMGSDADEVRRMMEAPRPPRMADWFDNRLSLPVTLRRQRYRMRIHYEVTRTYETAGMGAGETPGGEQRPLPVTPAFAQPSAKGIAAASGPLLENQAGDPRDIRAIFDEALRHHQAGRIDEALALYERALFLRPDYADVHSNMGVALFSRGRVDEAVEHYERAVVLNPEHANALNNLGAALATQGRLEEAAARCQRAVALDSDHIDAHSNLGDIFRDLGRFEDAIRHYDRVIALRPDRLEAYYHRGEMKTFRRGDPDLAALETLAGKNNLPASKTAFVHFALAKALEDSGDYARAFEQLSKGNASKRSQMDYDERRVADLFERIATVFDRRLFDSSGGAGDPSAAPIFVVGMPRSGSTLIEQILAGHPQVHAAGELGNLENAATMVLNARNPPVLFPEGIAALDAPALRRIGQLYLASLPSLPEGKVRITDKLPENFLRIGLIRLVLPHARIVHTVRDPIDTCVSCYSKLFTFRQEFSYDLAELGRYYRRYHALMNHWRSVLPQDAILDVSYEEVVNDLEGQSRRLIDYCGLPWDDRCVSFHESSRPVRTASNVQVRKPLFRSSIERWRHYEAGLAPLLSELGDIVARPNDKVNASTRHVVSNGAG